MLFRSLAADPLAEPQAVEAQGFERVDNSCEAVVVETCARAERVTNSNVRGLRHGQGAGTRLGSRVQLVWLPNTRRRAT